MVEILTVVMRCVHISSAVVLLGGIFYARLAMIPSEGELSPSDRDTLDEGAARHFRPAVFAALPGLVLSGIFNYLVKPGHSIVYIGLFCLKILLALHVFAIALLIAAPHNPRRARKLLGAAISGVVILLISAYLKGIA